MSHSPSLPSLPHGRVRKLLDQAPWRTMIPLIVVVVVAVAAAVTLGHEVHRHLAAVESWIAGLGTWGVLAFVGLFVIAASVLVPDTVLCVVAGALFGLWWGLAAVVVATLLAATLQFALARHLLRAAIQRFLARRPALATLQRVVVADQVRLQILLRLTPLNPATVSYLLGAAGVRLGTFLVALGAVTPHLFLEVYIGHAGTHVARLAGGASAAARLDELALFVGLALVVVAVMAVSRAAKRALARAVDAADAAAPGNQEP